MTFIELLSALLREERAICRLPGNSLASRAEAKARRPTLQQGVKKHEH
jgi:hypothetical protein